MHQQAKLEWIAATGPRLHRIYRAYLLKEGLQHVSDPAALIALAMLSLGGHRPPLPGR